MLSFIFWCAFVAMAILLAYALKVTDLRDQLVALWQLEILPWFRNFFRRGQ